MDLSTLSLIVTRASIVSHLDRQSSRDDVDGNTSLQLMLFDWIMTTFTGGEQSQSPTTEVQPGQDASTDVGAPLDSNQQLEKLRVKVKLSEVRAILNDDGTRLATLSLQAADVSVLLRGPSMRVAARLGNLSLTDDFEGSQNSLYKQLLTIEGDNLADFQYEKYDSNDGTYPGYDSLVYLRSGSFRFNFVEAPLHRILRFLTKFGRMKAVYDATTNAAAQQAAQLQGQANKMKYDILVRTPILVFPRAIDSYDAIVANLGEMSVENTFSTEGGMTLTRIDAALSKIRLSSRGLVGQEETEVRMLKDVDLSFDIVMIEGDRSSSSTDKMRPETEVSPILKHSLQLKSSQIVGRMSDVRMQLTAWQYASLMGLATLVPRTFSSTAEELAEDEGYDAQVSGRATPNAQTPSPATEPAQPASETVDLFPELAKVAVNEQGEEIKLHSKLEFVFTVKTVNLELFTRHAISTDTLKDNGLARFSLNETDVKYKMMSNGSMEAEVLLRSFVSRYRTVR